MVSPPDDGASLAIPPGSRLTSLRPRARPATVLAAGEAARLATQAASLSASAATATEPQAEPAGTRIALNGVGVSRRPAARPGDFSKAVEAAVAAAVRAPERQAAAAAPSEPEAQDEPEPTAAPQIPTRASVAKQATFVNAISLSDTNLIGIYGPANNRHALVRQSNGRFKKIKVGDRVDGGTVAAITATEVRYQKGGRMLALALPRG
ncbi:hypothetical protein [Rhodobacter ferrooxidans]|uniref:Pilus assembly protein PilP n=1 Tax=Rhodobacter ferrooxidans TaxID=371731 RepID=C8S491_9RHOB|nr:hypothetical protein [Rhodobacter sp. SW2]EEW24205.1 conserved hypothetical protein [Rhodobacter sp. SW2]